MTGSELREIKKRLKFNNENIRGIAGCCVSEKGEIISRFRQDIRRMGNEEGEKALTALRRVLSGKSGSTGYDIEFSADEVTHGERHSLLMALRESSLGDEEALEKLFNMIASSLRLEQSYIVMAVSDKYDVFSRGRNGDSVDSTEVFRYFTVAICPIKQPAKPLTYSITDGKFRDFETGWQLSPPEAGFMFPAFDNRSTNINSVRYFSKSPENIHPELIEALFGAVAPRSSSDSRLGFNSAASGALHEDLDADMYFGIQDRLTEFFEEEGAGKNGELRRDAAETVMISKPELSGILRSCGASDAQRTLFEELFDEQFGDVQSILASSLIDGKKLRITAGDAVISIPSDKTDTIETRMIDGVRYLMIRVGDGLTINGENVSV